MTCRRHTLMHMEKSFQLYPHSDGICFNTLQISWHHCRQVFYNVNSIISNSQKYKGLLQKEGVKQKISLFNVFAPWVFYKISCRSISKSHHENGTKKADKGQCIKAKLTVSQRTKITIIRQNNQVTGKRQRKNFCSCSIHLNHETCCSPSQTAMDSNRTTGFKTQLDKSGPETGLFEDTWGNFSKTLLWFGTSPHLLYFRSWVLLVPKDWNTVHGSSENCRHAGMSKYPPQTWNFYFNKIEFNDWLHNMRKKTCFAELEYWLCLVTLRFSF